jgi:hypothetical protein
MNPAEILGKMSALRLEAAQAGYQVALSESGQLSMLLSATTDKPLPLHKLSIDEARALVDSASQADCVLQVGDTCYYAHTAGETLKAHAECVGHQH